MSTPSTTHSSLAFFLESQDEAKEDAKAQILSYLATLYAEDTSFREKIDEVAKAEHGNDDRQARVESWLHYLAGNPSISGHGPSLILIAKGQYDKVFDAINRVIHGVF